MNARSAYYLGHFEGPFISDDSSLTPLKDSIFAWKCSIKARATTPAPLPATLPLPLKQSLALWSRSALGGPIDGAAWFKVLEGSAGDPAVDEDSAEMLHLMAVESFIVADRFEEAFSVLKRMKASCVDGQAFFIHLLCLMGNAHLAHERLQKMRTIPGWSNDLCFQLAELTVALSNTTADDDEGEGFGLKEAVYSLQEMIQLYGQSDRLMSGLAGLYAMMGKFGDAQAALSKTVRLDADGQATAVAISVHLSGHEEAINCSIKCCKEHKLKHETSEKGATSSASASTSTETTANTTETMANTDNSTDIITPTTSNTTQSLAARLESSEGLKTFLFTHPYLRSHLPVLLARIHLLTQSSSSSSSPKSALSKDLERDEKVIEVLKETLKVDPEVAALYDLLYTEGFLE